MSKGFKTYIVGGAVRDRLLGLPVQDRDWVVVGATPEQMLAAGFRPVGKDFPVFLHPKTQEEYALARTERKTAPGYTGFVFHADPGVRLEDDLVRRDLTINAMAEDDHGQLIDPFGGQADLAARIFRHVSPAFLEDPVRILRLARFAARFPDFRLAPETLALMQEMVANGEIDHLVPERVWQEISRGLMYQTPSRMIAVLRECGALARLLPELDRLFGIPQPPEHHPEIDTGLHVLSVIDCAAVRGEALAVRWAALLHDLGKGTSPRENWPHHYGHEERGVALVEAVCTRLKVPVDCRDLALLVCREHGTVHITGEMRAATLTSFLERIDALRRPGRMEGLLAAASCDFHGRPGYEARDFPAPVLVRRAYAAFAAVDAGAVVRGVVDKSHIPARLHEVRCNAVRAVLEPTTSDQPQFVFGFHDSEVKRIEQVGDSILILFSAAAVRELPGDPIVKSGHLQGLEIAFINAKISGPVSEALGRLASGNVALAGQQLNAIQVPCELNGELDAEFIFNNGARLVISAHAAVFRFSGEIHFNDSYAC